MAKARTWFAALAAASVVTVLLVLVLSFAHRRPEPDFPTESNTGIQIQTMDTPETNSTDAPAATSPNLSSILPDRPLLQVAKLDVESPPLDVNVELSQMLKWRYSYSDMSSATSLPGSFGVSNMANLDGAIESVVIPANQFPPELIDAGIYEGRVIVTILIDPKGRATVKHVHSSTHPLLVPKVVEALNRSVFSIPERNGQPTSAMVRRSIIFNASPENIRLRKLQKSQ